MSAAVFSDYETPTTRAAHAGALMMTIRGAVDQGRWIDALRNAEAFADVYAALIADVAQEAYNAGATKKEIAHALGVTPATFRGMERTR